MITKEKTKQNIFHLNNLPALPLIPLVNNSFLKTEEGV